MPTLSDVLADKALTDDMKITLPNGVETTLGEMREGQGTRGYLRTQDYTKKTQDLARERHELAAEKVQFEGAKAEAERLMMAQAAEMLKGTQTQPAVPLDEVEAVLQRDPVAKKLLSKIEAMDAKIAERDKQLTDAQNRLQQHEQTYMADQHRRMLAHIKSQDKDADEQAIVAFAQANYIPRLDLAYRLMSEDRRTADAVKAAKDEAAKEGFERGRQAAIAPPVLPNRRFAPSLAKDAPTTFEDAAAAAAADPQILAIMDGRESWPGTPA